MVARLGSGKFFFFVVFNTPLLGHIALGNSVTHDCEKHKRKLRAEL